MERVLTIVWLDLKPLTVPVCRVAEGYPDFAYLDDFSYLVYPSSSRSNTLEDLIDS